MAGGTYFTTQPFFSFGTAWYDISGRKINHTGWWGTQKWYGRNIHILYAKLQNASCAENFLQLVTTDADGVDVGENVYTGIYNAIILSDNCCSSLRVVSLNLRIKFDVQWTNVFATCDACLWAEGKHFQRPPYDMESKTSNIKWGTLE
jgi:hypothetical protein